MKKENEKDNIFNYIAFGSTADFINRNFKKGQMALITSEVNNNHYEDKDGKKQFREQFIVESIEFYGYKNENDSSDKKEDSPKATTDTPKVVWFFLKNKKEEPSVKPEKPSEPVLEPTPVVPKEEEKEPEEPKEEVKEDSKPAVSDDEDWEDF